MKIERVANHKEMTKGTWAPFGDLILFMCPSCGTNAVIDPAMEGEIHCPNEECSFFCQATDLEGLNADGTKDAARRGGKL